MRDHLKVQKNKLFWAICLILLLSILVISPVQAATSTEHTDTAWWSNICSISGVSSSIKATNSKSVDSNFTVNPSGSSVSLTAKSHQHYSGGFFGIGKKDEKESTTITFTVTNSSTSNVAVSFIVQNLSLGTGTAGNGSFSVTNGSTVLSVTPGTMVPITLAQGGSLTFTLVSGKNNNASSTTAAQVSSSVEITEIRVSQILNADSVQQPSIEYRDDLTTQGCSASFSKNTDISGTFVANIPENSPYILSHWEASDGTVLSRNTTYTVNEITDKQLNVKAVFRYPTVSFDMTCVDTQNAKLKLMGTEYTADVTLSYPKGTVVTSEFVGHSGVSYVISENGGAAVAFTGSDKVLNTDIAISVVPIASVGTDDQYHDPSKDSCYSVLEAALSVSSSAEYIILLRNYTVVESTITLNSNDTLVIPLSAADTNLQASDSKHPYANHKLADISATTNIISTDTPYLMLSIPSDCTFTVKGTMAIGGVTSGGGSGHLAGVTLKEYSNLILDGTLVVDGIFSTKGYVLGTGIVDVSSTGKIYLPMIIMDYHGGGYTSCAAGTAIYAIGGKSGESFISPFLRYTLPNIQTKIRMVYGATLNAYCDLNASDSHNLTTGTLIGTDTGLIMLKNGATLISEYYEDQAITEYANGAGIGKTVITLSGGASYGNLPLTASGATINTKELTFPVSYNYSFILEDGDYEIAYSMQWLPGSSLTVGKGAVLTIGGSTASTPPIFAVYDGLRDFTRDGEGTITSTSGASRAYPSSAQLQDSGYSGTADFIIAENGKLVIKGNVKYGGLIQTTSDQAVIDTTQANSSNMSATVQIGLVGSKYVLIKNYKYNGATVRTLDARIYNPYVGDFVPLLAGYNYSSLASASSYIKDYSYTLYTASGGTSIAVNSNENSSYGCTFSGQGALVKGGWYNYTVTFDGMYGNNTTGESGTALDPIVYYVVDNQVITAPVPTAYETLNYKYSFANWDNAVATTVTESAVYNAVYSKTHARVVFYEAQRNRELLNTFVAVGESITAPAVYSFDDIANRLRYILSGWGGMFLPVPILL